MASRCNTTTSLTTLLFSIAFVSTAVAQPESPPSSDTPSTPATDTVAREASSTEDADPSEVEATPTPPKGSGGTAIFPVRGTNLKKGQSAALGVLITSEFEELTSGRVLAPEVTGDFLVESEDYLSAAGTLGVEQYIVVKAVHLRRKVVITAILHDTNGTRIHSAKMTAASIDDFEAVSERLVKALYRRTTARETRTLDTVTRSEAKRKNRVFSEKVMGFKTGYILPVGASFDLDPMIAGSFDGRLEGDSYFIEFGAGIIIPATSDGETDFGEPPVDDDSFGYGGVQAELGASYYLTHSEISPYVGAGVMPRILSSQPASMAVYGQVGAMFLRSSSSRIYADFRVAQNLTEMTFEDYSDSNPQRRTATPTELGLNVGIGW